MMAKKKTPEGATNTKILQLENKVNQLDRKFDRMRSMIGDDMREMLEEFLGKPKSSREVEKSEDVQDDSM